MENDTNGQEKLPKIAIFQSDSNDKYLHYKNYISEIDVQDCLQFDGDYTYSLVTRFELVQATTGDGHYHIRCMYNNKYWSRGQSEDGWITASANDPEEDTSKWSCTLFQPVFVDDGGGDNKKVQFRHVYSGFIVAQWRYGCLRVIDTSRDPAVFIVIDWQSIVLLPSRIVIKGDNGLYLRTWEDGSMHFSRESMGREDLEYEVTPSRNGGFRLRSVALWKYWRDDDDDVWVSADNHYENHYPDTVFLPVKLDNCTIALRCLRSNLYCKRYTNDDKSSCLARVNTCIEDEAYLEIGEPVFSRRIDCVNYHLNDATISDENVLVILNEEVINKTQDTDKVTLDIKYTDTQTSSWNATTSLKLGLKTKISADVPILAEGTITLSAEFSGSYSFGENIQRQTQVGSSVTVSVPPMSKVNVSLVVTQGSCDIPYSYTQYDLLTDGTLKFYENHDGMYTCQNSYNYRYKTEQFPLDDQAS